MYTPFYKKVIQRVGAKFLKSFGHFGAKTFLRLSYNVEFGREAILFSVNELMTP